MVADFEDVGAQVHAASEDARLGLGAGVAGKEHWKCPYSSRKTSELLLMSLRVLTNSGNVGP